MNLIDRYVHQVGKRLPKKQRSDVEKELRSLLSDMVEDRAQTKVDKADEEIIVEVLREFGSPTQVADSYQPRKKYLIGPELYPLFKLVVTIVISVLSALALVGIIVSTSGSETFFQDFLAQFASGFFDFVGGLISVFANIVIVFAVLERVLPAFPNDDFALEEEGEWDPRSLEKIDDSTHVSRFEAIAGVVFGILFLIFLNLFPDKVGVWMFDGDQTQTYPLLSANFYDNLLIWVNVSLVANISVDMFKLWYGKRTRLIGWMEVGTTLLSAAVIYMFITNGPVFSVDGEGIGALTEVFTMLARIGFPIAFIALLFSAGKKVFDLLKGGAGENGR